MGEILASIITRLRADMPVGRPGPTQFDMEIWKGGIFTAIVQHQRRAPANLTVTVTHLVSDSAMTESCTACQHRTQQSRNIALPSLKRGLGNVDPLIEAKIK